MHRTIDLTIGKWANERERTICVNVTKETGGMNVIQDKEFEMPLCTHVTHYVFFIFSFFSIL